MTLLTMPMFGVYAKKQQQKKKNRNICNIEILPIYILNGLLNFNKTVKQTASLTCWQFMVKFPCKMEKLSHPGEMWNATHRWYCSSFVTRGQCSTQGIAFSRTKHWLSYCTALYFHHCIALVPHWNAITVSSQSEIFQEVFLST